MHLSLKASRRARLLAALILAFAIGAPSAARTADEPPLTALKGCEKLEEKAPHGTFVLYIPANGRWGACNARRAAKRFLPASTYKVPHALIGLETGVVKDEHAKVKWDGVKRGIPAWNADTSLASGLRNSTVWFYQAMAKRIGWETMREWVRKLGYGNEDIGPPEDLTRFWLTGALRISAVEEVRFLDRLRRKDLPALAINQEKVRAMMEIDRSTPEAVQEWVVYAKTGAVLAISADKGKLVKGEAAAGLVEGLEKIGWIVGWVGRPETQGGDAVFALNLDLDSPGALGLRKPLAYELLAANGILPAAAGR